MAASVILLLAGFFLIRTRLGKVFPSLSCTVRNLPFLSDNIWWHQPWRQGVPKSATQEEGGGGG
jgi:hypothetical protein